MQLRFEIQGLQGQRIFDKLQIQFIDVELADLKTLQVKGLARKPRILELKREQARLSGMLSQLGANIARTEQHIIETELKIVEMERNHLKEITSELSNVRSKILDLNEQIISAKDVLSRLDIVAPIEGVIMSMTAHTLGGVIVPGDTIMEIIPTKDPLIIEARIRPSDIDHLHVGLSSKIRFTALNRKFSKLLDGKVIFISPDGLVEKKTGALHFLVKIALDENTRTLQNNQKIIPGMQTEVMIQTGTKTPLDYILDPLAQAFNRAWREK